MKKIAIFATYLGKINRGAETFVIELTKELRKEFDITIYSSGVVDEIKDEIKLVSYKLPRFFNFYKKAYFKFKVFSYLIDKTYYLIPDVIEQYYFNKGMVEQYKDNMKEYDLIFPNNGIHGAKLAQRLRSDYKIPFIYTGHGGIGKGEELILRENPNAYIALTEENKLWAKKYSKNIFKVYNGVDLSRFKTDNNQIKSNKKVLCVAAFTPFKRQKLLIDAVTMLEGISLTLLGKGEQEEELTKYGKEKLRNRFIIKSVSYNEIINYYKEAAVFSLPSLNEPFGIVYLEAMAMNIPIVVPNDLNRKEIIGEAGIYCDVENKTEYAEAIKKALTKEWRGIPQNRAQNFSWKSVGKQYMELINKIIGDN